MNIPLQYKMTVSIEGIELNVPEPEAFALHKLIVAGLRENPDQAKKDLESAIGLLRYFEDKSQHMHHLREIYSEFPKGWRNKINVGLEKAKPFFDLKL